MTAPSIGIAGLLVTAGVATFDPTGATIGSWPVYISKLPDSPDSCISIYDNGGAEPDPKWLLDYPNVSIMVRSQAYLDCFQKARDIRSSLLGLAGQTINGDRWDSIRMIGDVTDIGRDLKDRVMRSMTFKLIIQPASTSLDIRLPL